MRDFNILPVLNVFRTLQIGFHLSLYCETAVFTPKLLILNSILGTEFSTSGNVIQINRSMQHLRLMSLPD